jgi:hypothetical protein
VIARILEVAQNEIKKYSSTRLGAHYNFAVNKKNVWQFKVIKGHLHTFWNQKAQIWNPDGTFKFEIANRFTMQFYIFKSKLW